MLAARTFRRSILRQQQQQQRRYLSSGIREQLRVAVVGGGVAGLSTALHLAPLVESGCVAHPIDVFDAGNNSAREIGVGVWSTALDPFISSNIDSHQMVYDEMTSKGTWLDHVGYRIPNGKWLCTSHLPTSRQACDETGQPALLFLREVDLFSSLSKAVHLEQRKGRIQLHAQGNKTRVAGLQEDSSQSWSTKLQFANSHSSMSDPDSFVEDAESIRFSDRDYHLIIAADGMGSVLRQRYGGFDGETIIRPRMTGTAGMGPSPNVNSSTMQQQSNWTYSKQLEAVGLQDREYTVFRGNAPLASSEMGLDEATSFQTWGEGRSMRYAVVPMRMPNNKEHHVWFATIQDDAITSETDPVKRQELLLQAFSNWHDPIGQTIAATPASEILMERAIAHRHSMGPVLNFNHVIKQLRGSRPPSAGDGPCIVFIGDSYMTVDPILAQGFTVGMEGASALRASVEASYKHESPSLAQNDSTVATLAFDPYIIRRQLKQRHDARIDRLICLLRATELVQALGQPNHAISGKLSIHVLRPLMRVCPNAIKGPIFDAVLKYSLGLYGRR